MPSISNDQLLRIYEFLICFKFLTVLYWEESIPIAKRIGINSTKAFKGESQVSLINVFVVSSKFSAIFLSAVFIGKIYSQKETYNWYFGKNAGIVFDGTSLPVGLSGSVMNTAEACSSISDKNGNLLFYTNGVNAWDNTNVMMPNSTSPNLMGNPSTSQTLIVQQPGNDSLYYIFTNDQQASANGFRYSIVNMKLRSGMGEVELASKNISPTPGGLTTEKVTAVKHRNKKDVWVIIHEWNSNVFRAYLLTDTGLNAPVNSSVGPVHTGGAGNGNAIGNMKASPDGCHLALAIRDSVNFELFDLNNATGVLSNPRWILPPTASATAPGSYGVEFSPDGNFLYGTCSPSTGIRQIYQFDLLNLANKNLLATGAGVGTGLQLGPDGRIYISQNTSACLGVINNPNEPGAACNYVPSQVALPSGTCLSGLPGFVQSYFNTFTFSLANQNGCKGDSVHFHTSTCDADSLLWNFDDPASGPANASNIPNAAHLFSVSGTYTVSLIKYQGGFSDTVTNTIYITISSPIDAVLILFTGNCTGVGTITVTPTGGTGVYSYNWLPSGGNNFIASNLGSNTYTVTITDSNGCSKDTAVTLMVPSPPVLSASSTDLKCFNDSSGTAKIVVSGGTPGFNYAWVSSSGMESGQSLSHISAGSYVVQVTDANNCIQTATVTITQPPVLITTVTTTFICDNATGNAAVNVSGGTGIYTYSWSSSPAQTTSIAKGLPEGNYVVVVTDENGCQNNLYPEIAGNCEASLYVPSAFTPNADGKNEILLAEGISVSVFQMRVFDNWGQLIFVSNDMSKGWDGTYKGVPAKEDVYVCEINYQMLNKKVNRFVGRITLIR